MAMGFGTKRLHFERMGVQEPHCPAASKGYERCRQPHQTVRANQRPGRHISSFRDGKHW